MMDPDLLSSPSTVGATSLHRVSFSQRASSVNVLNTPLSAGHSRGAAKGTSAQHAQFDATTTTAPTLDGMWYVPKSAGDHRPDVRGADALVDRSRRSLVDALAALCRASGDASSLLVSRVEAAVSAGAACAMVHNALAADIARAALAPLATGAASDALAPRAPRPPTSPRVSPQHRSLAPLAMPGSAATAMPPLPPVASNARQLLGPSHRHGVSPGASAPDPPRGTEDAGGRGDDVFGASDDDDDGAGVLPAPAYAVKKTVAGVHPTATAAAESPTNVIAVIGDLIERVLAVAASLHGGGSVNFDPLRDSAIAAGPAASSTDPCVLVDQKASSAPATHPHPAQAPTTVLTFQPRGATLPAAEAQAALAKLWQNQGTEHLSHLTRYDLAHPFRNSPLATAHPSPTAVNALSAFAAPASVARAAERTDSVLSDAGRAMAESTTTVLHAQDDAGVVSINQYLVMADLGSGAQAPVVHALNVETGMEVAIKIIPRPRIRENVNSNLQRNQLRQFKLMAQEIMAMHKCRHKNLVRLREVIDDPQSHSLFLVMEYVAGGCIAVSRADGTVDRRYSPAAVVHFGRCLCAALQYLHDHGIFHRDIKPENILLRGNGEPCFCDFGMCDVLDYVGEIPIVNIKSAAAPAAAPCGGVPAADVSDISTNDDGTLPVTPLTPRAALHSSSSDPACGPHRGLQCAHSFRGTVAFAPPECHQLVPSKTDNRFAADVWALGLSLYCLLYGRLPWSTLSRRDYIQNMNTIDVPFPPTWGEAPPLATHSMDAAAAAAGVDPFGRAADDDKPPEELVDLLRQMMARDPAERLDIEDARAKFKALSVSFGEALDGSMAFGNSCVSPVDFGLGFM